MYSGSDMRDKSTKNRSLASARRQLWEQARQMTDDQLAQAIKVKEYQLSDPEGVRYSYGAVLKHVDLWYLRMYRTEQRRRQLP